MQHICSSLVSIFALVTLKGKTEKHFWREKARAPVNVCPFRNRLFCIRSDIHCDDGTMRFSNKFNGLKVIRDLEDARFGVPGRENLGSDA